MRRSWVISLALVLSFGGAWSACGQSSRPGMGAVPYADANGTGVTFRVWGGSCTSVSVAYSTASGWRQVPLRSEGNAIWSLDVAGIGHGTEYKFILNGPSISNAWKGDPRASRVPSSDTTANSIVYDHSRYAWQSPENFHVPFDDLVIYEMHVGAFNAESWLPGTFDTCIEKIPYLKKLGISAVQLMPINEFPTDRSWGYNPAVLFAVESSYGGADGLKRFVDACHEAGIAVLLDVVHNHYGPTDLTIWQYDGVGSEKYSGMYFYNDWRADTMWGLTRPNFDEAQVRSFIRDHIFYWLENFRVDGFRWDSVYHIMRYGEYNDLNPAGVSLLKSINEEMDSAYPNAYRIAEDNARDADMKFQSQWAHGYLSDLRYMAASSSDADRNMDTLAAILAPKQFDLVIYTESHDTCGDLNEGKARLPREIMAGNPQDYYAKKRAFLANAAALVSCGIPMIFMGSEFNEDYNFSNNTALRWSTLGKENSGLIQAYADLIRLRRNLRNAGTPGFRDNENAAVIHNNNNAKVLGLKRGDDLFVVFNWSYVNFGEYKLDFPSSGTWYCAFNSDWSGYDATFGNTGPALNETVSAAPRASIAIGPYSVQVYSKNKRAEDSTLTHTPAAPSDCTGMTLTYAPRDSGLQYAAAVQAVIERNGDAQDVWLVDLARQGDGTWRADVVIPPHTDSLRMTLLDDEGNRDDNDGTAWVVDVAQCPADVVLDPAEPSGCQTRVTFSYAVNSGPLAGAADRSLTLHIGINGWNHVQDIPMQHEGGNRWSCTYVIPDGAWALTYCFVGNGTEWDNNGGNNWEVLVADCVQGAETGFAVTTPLEAIVSVEAGTRTQWAAGVATNLVGDIGWTNLANGASGAVAASADWVITDIPLATGTNTISIFPVNPNAGIADADYSSFQNGDNGGTGFLPWQITTNTSSGSWGAGTAWGLWANKGAIVEAIRPLAADLQPGDALHFTLRNGSIENGCSVGVGFQNERGQNLLEYYFYGGDAAYSLKDRAGIRSTGLPWHTNAVSFVLTVQSNRQYALDVQAAADSRTFTGELAHASLDGIRRIRFWNYSAGTGGDYDFYVSALSADGAVVLPPFSAHTFQVVVPPFVETVSLHIAADGTLRATFQNATADQVADNIWGADVLEAGRWKWRQLDAAEYRISGNEVRITPGPGAPFAIYSIGRPADAE